MKKGVQKKVVNPKVKQNVKRPVQKSVKQENVQQKRALTPGEQRRQAQRQSEYLVAEKFTFAKLIESIPKSLYPTVRTAWYLAGIFILVIVISAFFFPFGAFLSGDFEGVKYSIGIPWDFFVLNFEFAEEMPIKPLGLIGDTLIYIIVAYLADILTGYILSKVALAYNPKKGVPEVYEDPVTRKQVKNQDDIARMRQQRQMVNQGANKGVNQKVVNQNQ